MIIDLFKAENALNKMQEDLSNEDLVSAHIDRWTANQWLKLSELNMFYSNGNYEAFIRPRKVAGRGRGVTSFESDVFFFFLMGSTDFTVGKSFSIPR